MRRDSCRSVPTMKRPPFARTSFCSSDRFVREVLLELLESLGIFRFLRPVLGHRFGVAAEDDVGSAARHVRRDRDRALPARLGDDVRFALVEFRVQDDVRNPSTLEKAREALRLLDRNGADEDGLALLVQVADRVGDRVEFLHFGSIDRVLVVDPNHRPVRRDHRDREAVDFVELVGFRVGRSRHSGQLVVHPEVVLERDRRERLVFLFDLDAFLRFDGLVKTV